MSFLFILPIDPSHVTLNPEQPEGRGSRNASHKTRAKDSVGPDFFLPVKNARSASGRAFPPQALRKPDPGLSGVGQENCAMNILARNRAPRVTPGLRPRPNRAPDAQLNSSRGQHLTFQPLTFNRLCARHNFQTTCFSSGACLVSEASLDGPASARRNSIQNSLPLMPSEFTPVLPPIRSTAFRTMARPMPVPS